MKTRTFFAALSLGFLASRAQMSPMKRSRIQLVERLHKAQGRAAITAR